MKLSRDTTSPDRARISRREALLGAVGMAYVVGVSTEGRAADNGSMELLENFLDGSEATEEGISLTTPEIAENGNAVPVEVEAPGAEAVLLIASGNPHPEVATIRFGSLAAEQRVKTRIRLSATQDVIAAARFSDGRRATVSRRVKVTIGGCGG